MSGMCSDLRASLLELLAVHRWQNCRSGSEKSRRYVAAVRQARLVLEQSTDMPLAEATKIVAAAIHRSLNSRPVSPDPI